MSEGDGGTMGSKQSAAGGFDSWPEYWQAQGMPWRTEPEVDGERQHFLDARRSVTPDIERGLYPFRDEHGGTTLTGAHVGGRRATPRGGGRPGPGLCGERENG